MLYAANPKQIQVYHIAILLFFLLPLPTLCAVLIFLFVKIWDLSVPVRRYIGFSFLILAALLVFLSYINIEKAYPYTAMSQFVPLFVKKRLNLPKMFDIHNLFLSSCCFVALQIADLARVVRVPEQIRNEIREREKNSKPLNIAKITKRLRGKEFDPARGVLLGATRGGEAFFISPDELNTHCALIGTTGSGKTTTIYRFAEYTMRSGQAGIFIDGKGDVNFRRTIERLAEKYGRTTQSFSMDVMDGLSSYNPFLTGTPSELTDKIIALTDWSEEHYKLSSQRFLQLLFRAFIKLGISLDLPVITEYCNKSRLVSELRRLRARQVEKAREDEADDNLYYKTIVDEEIQQLISSLESIDINSISGIASRLGVIAEGDMRELIKNQKNTIDLSKVLDDRQIVIFSLDSLRYPEQARLMGRLIVNDLKACIAEHQRNRRGERVSLIFDEFNVFASASVVDLINKSRSAGFEALLSFQSLADIAVLDHGEDIKNQIIQNCNTLIVQRQNAAKDAEELAETFGTKDTYTLTVQAGRIGSTGLGSARSVKEFIYHPDDIKRLQTGEALVKRNVKRVSMERVFILPSA